MTYYDAFTKKYHHYLFVDIILDVPYLILINNVEGEDGYNDVDSTMIPFDTVTRIYFTENSLLITTENESHYKFYLPNSSINFDGLNRQMIAFKRIIGVDING